MSRIYSLNNESWIQERDLHLGYVAETVFSADTYEGQIRDNQIIFGLRDGFTRKQARDYCLRLIAEYRQLHIGPGIFYIWYDKMAGQIRSCAVNLQKTPLFGGNVSFTDQIDKVISDASTPPTRRPTPVYVEDM
jgi:hypothetical protein